MAREPSQFTPEFKAQVVLDLLVTGKSLSQASRELGIKDSVLSRWRSDFIERAPSCLRAAPVQTPATPRSQRWSVRWVG